MILYINRQKEDDVYMQTGEVIDVFRQISENIHLRLSLK